jgi:tetratricopeptide (TPR) repeat protein/DNA-binding CsgD family transcriptional regulator
MHSRDKLKSPSLPSEFYLDDLLVIKEVKFTPRQIDIIACLISGGTGKTISSLLGIEVKTLEAHKKDIGGRIGGGIQEDIIAFVQRSDKYELLKQHYLTLLHKNEFEKHLKELAKKVPKNFLILKVEPQQIPSHKSSILYFLLSHLQLVGIKIINDGENIEIGRQNYHTLAIISKDTSPSNLDKKTLLLLDKEIALNVLEDICKNGSNYIDFREAKNYFSSCVKVLKKLFSEIDLEKLILLMNPENLPFSENFKSDVIPNSAKKIIPRPVMNIFQKQRKWFVSYLAVSILFLFLIEKNLNLTIDFKNDSQKNVKEVTQKKLSPPENLTTWNLPLSFQHYTERKSLTKKIANYFSDINKKNSFILVGLHGLGGVGKTTLATNFIRNPPQNYEFRGWFSAETKDLLKADYFALGEKFNLFSEKLPDNSKINIVKEWLAKRNNILLVYDNVQDIETIKDFLPDVGHILITSRNYKMPGAIEIDIMDESEALDLMSKLIPEKILKTTDNKREIKNLIKSLGYLPLALSQAGSYISDNMINITEYSILYKANKYKLLSTKNLPPGDQHEPVYVTWDINIKKIYHLPEGKKALELLDFISYCYPENIPKKFLIHYLYGNTTNESEILFNNILIILRQYSLIKLAPEGISIHRLVHDWVRNLHDKTHKILILQKGIKTLKDICVWDDICLWKEIEFIRSLIPSANYMYSQSVNLLKDADLVDLMMILGDTNYNSGDYVKSKHFFDKILILQEKNFGISHVKTAKVLHRLGWVYYRLGDDNKAFELFKKSQIITEKYYGSSHVETANTLRSLGWIYHYLGEHTKAKQLSEKSQSLIEKHYGVNSGQNATLLRELSWINISINNYSYAEKLAKKSLEIIEKFCNNNQVQISYTLHALGQAQQYLGDYIKAKQSLEMVLAIREKYYGPNHIALSIVLRDLGWIYFHLEDYIKAKQLLERSLNILQKYYHSNHHKKIKAMQYLSWIYAYLGNSSKAQDLFKQSLIISEKNSNQNHLNISFILNNIGLLNLYNRNYLESEKNFHKSLTSIIKIHSNNHSYSHKLHINLGNLYRLRGEYKKGRELLEKAQGFFQESVGFDNLYAAVAIGNLGLLYGNMGDCKKKREYLENALIIFKKYLHPQHQYIKNTEQELQKMKSTLFNNLGYFIIFDVM